jgi:hypothetical protein
MSVSLQKPDELDNTIKVNVSPYYRQLKVNSTTIDATTLSATGTTDIAFDMPATSVYNLNQANLNFAYTLPASSAGRSNFNHQFGFPEISRIQATTRNGTVLCDLQDVNNYTRGIFGLTHTTEDLLNSRTGLPDDTPAEALTQSIGLTSNGVGSNTAATAALSRNSQVIENAGTLADGGVYIKGPLYLTPGTAATNSTLRCSYNLGKLVGTIFADNRDFYAGEIVNINFSFAPASKVGVEAALADFATPLPISVVPTLSDVHISLPVQRNQFIVNTIKNQVHSTGLNRVIPVTSLYKQIISSSTDKLITYRVVKERGAQLKRIVNMIFHATDSGATCLNLDNQESVKMETMYTAINGERTHDGVLSSAKSEDIAYLNKTYKGSLVLQDKNTFTELQTYTDEFTGSNSLQWHKTDMEVGGMDIGSDLLYEYHWTTAVASAALMLSYYTTNKMLRVSSNGVQLMNH